MRDRAFRRAFGRAFKEARLAAGLTQRELSEKGGVAEKYLSRIEVGIATPSLPVATRLARLLNVGLDVLTGATRMAPEVTAIVALLGGKATPELVRARWLLEALFRPSEAASASPTPKRRRARRVAP